MEQQTASKLGKEYVKAVYYHPTYLTYMQSTSWEMLLLLLLLSRCSRVRLCATPYTAAHQAPPSLGFSRQEHWSGLPFPSPMHENEKWKWSRSVHGIAKNRTWLSNWTELRILLQGAQQRRGRQATEPLHLGLGVRDILKGKKKETGVNHILWYFCDSS